MNWKLILQLSLFGLAMAVGTVFFIPSAVEGWCWLAIFIICAYVIAKRTTSQPFQHGFMVSVMNSVWVTAVHVMLFDRYIAGHADEAAMMKTMPALDSPRLMMVLVGPVVGFITGIILGVFALIAAKLVARSAKHGPVL